MFLFTKYLSLGAWGNGKTENEHEITFRGDDSVLYLDKNLDLHKCMH